MGPGSKSTTVVATRLKPAVAAVLRDLAEASDGAVTMSGWVAAAIHARLAAMGIDPGEAGRVQEAQEARRAA